MSYYAGFEARVSFGTIVVLARNIRQVADDGLYEQRGLYNRKPYDVQPTQRSPTVSCECLVTEATHTEIGYAYDSSGTAHLTERNPAFDNKAEQYACIGAKIARARVRITPREPVVAAFEYWGKSLSSGGTFSGNVPYPGAMYKDVAVKVDGVATVPQSAEFEIANALTRIPQSGTIESYAIHEGATELTARVTRVVTGASKTGALQANSPGTVRFEFSQPVVKNYEFVGRWQSVESSATESDVSVESLVLKALQLTIS
jgi:hypothetical protein